MDRDILAKRYGDAFLAFTKEGCGIEKGVQDLHDVNRIFRDNPDFENFLVTPGINDLEKIEILDRVIRNGFSDEVHFFLKLLLAKGRLDKFSDIAEYVRIVYSHGKEIDALLKVSYPLDTETIRRIKELIEKKLNKKIHLYIELDSELLGGIYAKVENILIDGSVRRRLEDMKAKLLAAKVVYGT
ncbi:MAG: ATP synthase F1 subunit delta [Candidatus Omnitrophica bacterium]|nr:ATP synthase F1 subunit delta [Candidatus Omnitrophota bacterium]MDD5436472.1 ATP synthase F1 subunit delta [Candidatus Omnitrophota bacterium]